MVDYPENDTILAPAPIVFRVPWEKRYMVARELAMDASEHPFAPGYFASEIQAKQVPGASVLVAKFNDNAKSIYGPVAEITVHFRKVAWSVEPDGRNPS